MVPKEEDNVFPNSIVESSVFKLGWNTVKIVLPDPAATNCLAEPSKDYPPPANTLTTITDPAFDK